MEIFKEYENEISDINKITKGIKFITKMHKKFEKIFKTTITKGTKMKWSRMS
jgi:hypothetical protein